MYSRLGAALIFLSVTAHASDTMPAAPTAESSPASTLPAINCDYHFAKDVVQIDPEIINTWSKQAATQMFTFSSAELNKQLPALKNCFTDIGWQGFNAAFEKSGNLNAIQSKQLTVSSTIKGQPKIQVIKDNQWRVSIPMDVTYQNKENKIDQSLTVKLLIVRKPSGGLGVLQVLAAPFKDESTKDTAPSPKPPISADATAGT